MIKKTLTQQSELEALPEQLSLFTDLSEEGYGKYSNTFELWSIAPRIWVGGVKREKTKNIEALGIVKRDFEYGEKRLSLVITPAGIEDKKTGKKKDFYPSQREELIEEALIKIAARKMMSEEVRERPTTIDGMFAVKTTYYEIAKELLRLGHGYKIAEIKLGVEVGNKAIIEIKSNEGNEISYSTPMFPFVAKETKESGGGERLVIQLHPLVTKSMQEGTYRLLDYDKMMTRKKYLSRWLYRRISHNFTGADITKPYHIKLTTIVNNSAMAVYNNMAQMIKQVESCFDELKNCNAFERWERKRVVYDELKKSKILDIVYFLYPSQEFISDIIKANGISKNKDPKQLEEKINLEVLEGEMRKDIFQLSDIFIRQKLKKIKNKKDVENILLSLEAAEEKINSGQECNPVAYTKAAINEGYKPKKRKEKEYNVNPISSETKAKIVKEEVDFSGDERWIKIRKAIENGYDRDDWEKWLIFLDIKNIEGKIVEFSVPNKFVRDWILREFVYTVDEEKKLLSIVQSVIPTVKKLYINSLE